MISSLIYSINALVLLPEDHCQLSSAAELILRYRAKPKTKYDRNN